MNAGMFKDAINSNVAWQLNRSACLDLRCRKSVGDKISAENQERRYSGLHRSHSARLFSFGSWPIRYIRIAPSEPALKLGEIIGLSKLEANSHESETRTTMLDGPAYGKDRAPRAAEEFHASLKSGCRLHTVVVEVSYGATLAVRYRLDRAAATGKASEKQVREEVIAMAREFVEYELRQGGHGFWDPLKHPRKELNEPAVLFFAGRRD